MKSSWNDDEEAALQGMSWLAQIIYLRGIRRYMDYSSGIVGIKRGISYQSLIETVYVEPIPGRHKSACRDVTKKTVRCVLEDLEKHGLIKRVGDKKQLSFRCLLADTDQSVQNSRGIGRAQEGHTCNGTLHTSNYAGSSGSNGTGGAHPNTTSRGIPPVTGIRKKDKEKNSTKKKGEIDLSNLPDEISLDVALGFIEHRKALKKPLTQRAFDLAINKAMEGHTIGLTPDQVIDETVAAGWQGVNLQWLANRNRQKTDSNYAQDGTLDNSAVARVERAIQEEQHRESVKERVINGKFSKVN